jgi:Family of unknown function (DUF5681)
LRAFLRTKIGLIDGGINGKATKMGKFEKGQPNPGNRFKSGQSGNPGGRPKAIIEVAAAARERTTEAIETLAAIMRDTNAPPSARVSAATALLDRGWGKASQTIDLRHNGDLRTLTDDELIAIAAGEIATPNGGRDLAAAPNNSSKPH